MKNTPCFNRDISWIDFNARVLEEGLRPDLPLLERLRFLCIVSSNFDEFFMVRIATLKRAQRHGAGKDPSGKSPTEQIDAITQKIRALVRRQYACLNSEILSALAHNGLQLLRSDEYDEDQYSWLKNLFQTEIFPTLTPMRLEEDTGFPVSGTVRLYASFLLKKDDEETGDHIALVQLPASLSRIILLPKTDDGVQCWTLLDDVILRFAYKLFPGYSILEKNLFKVNRDADFGVDEERDDDFVQAMQEVLNGREQSRVVRLSVSADSPRLRDDLHQRMELTEQDIYEISGPIDLGSLIDICNIDGFDSLRTDHWPCFWPTELPKDEPLWDRLKCGDILLHHPYESFEPVLRLFRDAASDPSVLSIKTTLYRTSGNSPIIQALETAARNGKQVTALVELKARFDEERNINWAARLENAGVIVIYGLARLKVHAKATLIVRKEAEGVHRYLHLATGNYNDKTARFYTDMGLLSANDELAYELSLFFNTITGYSGIQNLRKLVMAPTTLKHRLIELIDRELKRSSQAIPGRIMAKMNSLADLDIINALYKASQAGVQIQLNIRGICMLIPGLPGVSENIQVVSIIDRYLEHSRLFCFYNGGEEEVYLSSADWMPRNLERRVELMFPILQDDLKQKARDVLNLCFADNTQAHYLDSQGNWHRKQVKNQHTRLRQQENLYLQTLRQYELSQVAPNQDVTVRRKTTRNTQRGDK
jgi:polyphosphate kinase